MSKALEELQAGGDPHAAVPSTDYVGIKIDPNDQSGFFFGAAKWSLRAPIVTGWLAVGLWQAMRTTHDAKVLHAAHSIKLWSLGISSLLLVSGLIMGVIALTGIRQYGAKGIVFRSVCGIIVSLLVIGANVGDYLHMRTTDRLMAQLDVSKSRLKAALDKKQANLTGTAATTATTTTNEAAAENPKELPDNTPHVDGTADNSAIPMENHPHHEDNPGAPIEASNALNADRRSASGSANPGAATASAGKEISPHGDQAPGAAPVTGAPQSVILKQPVIIAAPAAAMAAAKSANEVKPATPATAATPKVHTPAEAFNAYLNEIATAVKLHAEKSNALHLPPILGLEGVQSQADLQNRKQTLHAFMDANDHLVSLITNSEKTFREQLEKADVPEDQIIMALNNFRQRTATQNSLNLKMRQHDQRIAVAILNILDVLDTNWGKWSYSADQRKIVFTDTAALAKYNALHRDLNQANEDQSRLQAKLNLAANE